MTNPRRSGVGPLLNVPAEAHTAWTRLHEQLLKVRYQVPCTDEPELFTSNNHADRLVAVAICSGCPVQQRCRTYADTAREPLGVWGGKDRGPRPPKLRSDRPGDITPAEAAALCNVKLSSVMSWIYRGSIKRGEAGLIDQAELLAWRSTLHGSKPPPRIDRPGRLTTAEAAELCGVGRQTVYGWIYSGIVRRGEDGFIDQAELLAWRSGQT